MDHNEYWQERMLAIEEQSHDKGMKFAEHIDKQFRLAERNINRQIDYWYNKIAMNNEISLSAAKELLRKDELKDFHMSVEEYIEKGKQLDFDNSYMQELINASAKVHISRLEALKLQMQQECEVLYGNMADGLEDTLADIYTSAYYNTAYTFMKGTGVGWAFNKLDNNRIEKAINTAWSYDDKTFKARCWEHKKKLNNELNTILTQSIIRGESPQKAIEQLSKRMKVSRYNAGRLIMTESSAIYSASQKDAFKELDVERYEFVATLDSHTSETCRNMDGKIFDMKDYKVGVTAPPLHCFCRSVTVPYYEDNLGSIGERAARGADGKTYHVPANITYKEWEDTFVVDKDLATEMFNLKEHMLQLADKKYLNIWKDPVTVEQFRLKKSAIDAKRSYFNQKLSAATGEEKEKFKNLLADLEDFEKKGQEYEEIRKKVQKISKDLKRKANDGRIEDDRYSQERKDEAMWTEKVKEADGMLRSKCGEVWQDAPKEERQAIYDYTTGSGSFNRPLAGFEKPYYEYGSGWEEKYNKGVGNVWIDYEGKGASIRHMTDLIDKSEYDFDMWLQRGCDANAMESFLGLAQGTLTKMTEEELQQFVGTSARMYNFISCGVAKGKGFDSKPIILNIYAPAGTKMMYAEPFSHFGNGSKLSWDGISPQSSYGGEAEMIIQRGASYTITKIEQSNGTIYIDLEVHPEDGYDLIQQTDDWTGSKKTYKD